MTLTQAALITKQTIIFGGLLIFLTITSFVGFNIYKSLQPPPAPPIEKPTIQFGQLPLPIFPKEATASSYSFVYSLDTETGNLPTDLPNLVNVYPIPLVGATLLSSDRARELANKFGFTNGPQTLDSSTYVFTDGAGGEFRININTGNFKFQIIPTTPTESSLVSTIPDEGKLVTDFKKYLSSRLSLPGPVAAGPSRVRYDGTSQADSISALISLFSEPINKTPVVTPSFKVGLINSTLLKTNPTDNPYVRLSYTYWEPDIDHGSTYPLLPIDQAYANLKSNNGAIIIAPESNNASITKVYLAYYISDEYPTYYEPVYVFEGPDFVGYVPALLPQDYMNATTQTSN